MAGKNRKKILIAEDDPEIALLLRKVLEREYEVVHAKDGKKALELLKQKTAPNLIIADVMMPNLDGIGMVRVMKTFPNLKKIPVIFITAKTSSEDIIAGIQTGAKHYITKPFKIDDVMQKVRKILG